MKKAATKKSAAVVKKARSPKRATGSTAVVSIPDLQPHDEIIGKVRAATKSGKWLVAVIHIENDKIYLERMAVNFPKGDIVEAQRLFVTDLDKLKTA